MSKKKVLIIGGTGVAGQSIGDYLLRCHDICELFIASRGIHEISDKRVRFIKMDIHNAETLDFVIQQFDIIVLALGPFSSVGTEIYAKCLKNHVICIDINDDYKHCERILEMDNANMDDFRGTVLTGMGLCPGLTTFMLESAVEHLKGSASEAHLRIYFGAGVASGSASITNMFEGFKDEAMFLSAGEVQEERWCRRKIDKTFSFDHLHSNMPLVFFSSPEIKTIRRASKFRTLQDFDSAFHLQNLPMSLVYLLKKSSLVRKLICKIVNIQQKKLDKNRKNEKSVIVYASVKDQNSTVEYSLYSDSSYRLTGMFCAAIVILIIRGQISIVPGVFTFENLNINLHLLNDILESNNINITIKI